MHDIDRPDPSPRFANLATAASALAEAEALVARLLPLSTPADSASPDLQEHLASAWLRQIEALDALGRTAEVVAAADALCAHFEPGARDVLAPVFAPVAAWPWIARAQCEKARALAATGHAEAALDLLREVQRRFEQAQSPALREWIVAAGLEEARLRAAGGATFARVDMVRHCEDLARRFGGDDWLATRVLVARVRAVQARMLAELDYHDEALKKYAALHEDLQAATEPALKARAADAQHAHVRLLEMLGRDEEARALLHTLIAAHADAAEPERRQTLALARTDLALALQRDLLRGAQDEDLEERLLAACDAVLDPHADSDDATVLRCVNRILRVKAQLLRDRDAEPDDEDRADELAEWQWSRYAGHPDAQVHQELLLAMLDQLVPLDDPPRELAGYRRLLDRFGDDRSALLQPQLARTRLLEAWALRALDRGDEALSALSELDALHAESADAYTRLQCVHGRIERARILWARGDVEAALRALEGWTEARGAEDTALRRAIARAMDLRCDILQAQAPAAHPRPDGKDEEGRAIEVAVTEVEERYAAAVDALVARFAKDPVEALRTIAVKAQYALAAHWRGRLQFQRAVDAYAALLQAFAADTGSEVEGVVASAYLNQAYALMMLLDREADALPVYDALLARFPNATSASMRDTLAKAAASRLTCLNRLQRQGAAVSYGDQYEDLTLAQRDAIDATIERGRVLAVEGKHREAIACYDEVLQAHVESLHPELRRHCLDAMVRKGYSLGCLSQREAALAVNDEVIARYGNELSTSAEKDVALAMSNRAVQLDKLGRRAEELQTYDAIIVRWARSDVAYLRERVANARFCKAITIADTDLDAALALYGHVIDTCLQAPEVALRTYAAKSSVNRGVRLRKAGRYEEAVACCEALVEACGEEADKGIAAQVVKARIGLARSYGHVGQVERQVETLELLMALPAGKIDEGLRAELRAEYQQLRPSPLVKAARALGALFGPKK
ncbi:hypothetical protein APR50_09620 [Variovorax paradoxus]|uniref:hypothetical protein n=1 Tax=Variovorax paradoxus TaxID=34073 RepID=UPI0006E50C2D|nr:hypothetical protein APR52_00365 [Variovorax paradoxus]KPV05232.1 hypothetical protein APR49_22515 [Variovorax paradoxus]KPV09263.1 hypothetical protein APR50_09620 [Variovorax paradoxus]KPV19280.1 hypothetical protein APR51_20800 [Variovorax paradoxus]KPV28970.1 hypothetical protein APR48_24035 [Variovorax paradoxus]